MLKKVTKGQKPLLLWVEDEIEIRDNLSRYLEAQKVDFVVSGSNTEEIAKWLDIPNGISTAVIDLKLAGDAENEKSGLDIYKLIREKSPSIPITLISGSLNDPKWLQELETFKSIEPTELIFNKDLPPNSYTELNPILELIRGHEFGRRVQDEKTEKQIEVVKNSIIAINNGIIDVVAKEPEVLFKMTPRQFEELMAELFIKEGFKVELTPSTRDGGKDLYAFRTDSTGQTLYAVECKQYRPTHKVGRPIVQLLNGVIEQERLTGGVIATTSYFTKDAKESAELLKYRLFLQDCDYILNWIKKHSSG